MSRRCCTSCFRGGHVEYLKIRHRTAHMPNSEANIERCSNSNCWDSPCALLGALVFALKCSAASHRGHSQLGHSATLACVTCFSLVVSHGVSFREGVLAATRLGQFVGAVFGDSSGASSRGRTLTRDSFSVGDLRFSCLRPSLGSRPLLSGGLGRRKSSTACRWW